MTTKGREAESTKRPKSIFLVVSCQDSKEQIQVGKCCLHESPQESSCNEPKGKDPAGIVARDPRLRL